MYYDAAGTRYQTTYITRQGAATLASHQVMEQSAEQNASAALYYTYIYYNDNLEYTQTGGGAKVLSRVHNPEGYITPSTTNAQLAGSHYYYAKDHLGNIRETYQVTHTSGLHPYQVQTKQRVQYYPSGLPWAATFFSGANLQPYKYGGKEFVEMHGLDEYDSEARWYYPAIMRTTTMDPLCEKYYSISPYAWCGNNPVNLVDPDGRKLFYAPGSTEEFKANVQMALAYLKKNGHGDLYKKIMDSPNTYVIIESKITKFTGRWTRTYNHKGKPIGQSGTIEWNPEMGMQTDENVVLSPATALNHEFDHCQDFDENPAEHNNRHKKGDSQYDNKEERRVITGSEQDTARDLNEIRPGQTTRKSHHGKYVPVATPTSNVLIAF